MSRWFLFLALFLGGAELSFATENSALYQAKVTVRDQSFTERQSAIKQAFNQALLRLTGDKRILKSPVVLSAIRKSSNFVSRFSYLALERDDEDNAGEAKTSLLVQFDTEAMASLITLAGFEIWPNHRVMTTVIFGFYDFDVMGLDGDSIFFEEQREQWETLFTELGEQYVLPIQLVSIKTLESDWEKTHGRDSSALLSAADINLEVNIPDGLSTSLSLEKPPSWINDLFAYYSSTSLLLGQLSLNLNGQWQTRWQHYQPETYTQEFYTGSAQRVTQRLFWQVAKRLRNDYFNHRTVLEEATVYVTVQGVETLLTFQQVESVLQALDSTVLIRTVSLNIAPSNHRKSMTLAATSAGSVLFELNVKGGALQLQQELSLNNHFHYMVEELDGDDLSPTNAEHNPVLVYQWR